MFPQKDVRFAKCGLRYERFSSEAKLAYIRLNIQTPCPPRGAVPVNQGRTWEILSFCSFRIAFGHGCDCSSYVVKQRYLRKQRRKDDLAIGAACRGLGFLRASVRNHRPGRSKFDSVKKYFCTSVHAVACNCMQRRTIQTVPPKTCARFRRPHSPLRGMKK